MLRLPRRLTIGNLDKFLVDIADSANPFGSKSIPIDFQDLGFVDPAGVVALANACDYLRSIGFSPTARLPLPSSAAVSYLSDSRFFDLLVDPRTSNLSPGRSTTFPLTRVAHARTRDLLGNSFSPWLGQRLNLSGSSFEQIRMCLSELFNNISDHAEVSTGFFFAQHYPNIDHVDIGLADFGIGIPERVRRKLPNLDDGVALAKAFEEGFSTKTTPRNRGAGLDWLKRYVVESNGGVVRVASHRGRLRAIRRPTGTVFQPTVAEGFFPGVLYYIVLRTDTIEPGQETREELEW